MTLKLIRTVTHEHADGSEGVISVNTITFNLSPDLAPAVTLSVPGETHSAMIHSEAQARELFRAIRAAGRELGWFEED